MDFFGPLPITAEGNQVILVMIDHFTRWVEAVPLPNATAAAVAKELTTTWVPRHGFPMAFLSDNGKQFVAETVAHLCEGAGIKKLYSSPYNPQGNSVVESYMRTLKKGLAVLTEGGRADWDKQVSAVVFAYNTTPHTATGFTPFFLEHGREATLPLHLEMGHGRLPPAERVWLETLWAARRKVYEAQLREVHRRQEIIDRKDLRMPVGSWVAVRLSPDEKKDCPAKFAPSWGGPWEVVKCLSNGVTYQVRHPLNSAIRQVHVRHLKLLQLPAEEASAAKEPTVVSWQLQGDRQDSNMMGNTNFRGSLEPRYPPEDEARPVSAEAAIWGRPDDENVMLQAEASSATSPGSILSSTTRQRKPPSYLKDYVSDFEDTA